MELLLPGDGRQIRPERLEEVARMSTAAVAADLVSIIGLKRTAVVGDVKDTRLVQRWIHEGQIPQRAEALRTALQAARILNDVDGPAVATAWFGIVLGRIDAQVRQCREPRVIQFHSDQVRLALVERWKISEYFVVQAQKRSFRADRGRAGLIHFAVAVALGPVRIMLPRTISAKCRAARRRATFPSSFLCRSACSAIRCCLTGTAGETPRPSSESFLPTCARPPADDSAN